MSMHMPIHMSMRMPIHVSIHISMAQVEAEPKSLGKFLHEATVASAERRVFLHKHPGACRRRMPRIVRGTVGEVRTSALGMSVFAVGMLRDIWEEWPHALAESENVTLRRALEDARTALLSMQRR